MGNLKPFVLSSESGEYLLVLEVDLAKLTAERATQINTFWSDHGHRLDAEDGDVVRAVVRLYASRMIALMLAAGGMQFDAIQEPICAGRWTELMHIEEGWGGEDDTPHGWCGIRVLVAEVVVPGFDEVVFCRAPV